MFATALIPAAMLVLAQPAQPSVQPAVRIAPDGPAMRAPLPLAPLLVTWRPHQHGNDWYIRSGDNLVKMPDEKTAKKTAKKFNRIEKKEQKKEDRGNGDSFYDDGSGACNNPLIHC